MVLLSKEDTKIELNFSQTILAEMKKYPDDIFMLRKCLIRFKDMGMSKERMLENLEKLRTDSDFKTDNILLDLMDLVAGWCNSALSIF